VTTLPTETQFEGMLDNWHLLRRLVEAHIDQHYASEKGHMDGWEIDEYDTVIMRCSSYSSCSGEERWTVEFPVSAIWEKEAA